MGALFGKTPKPTPVTRMPDAEDPRVKTAEAQKRRQIMARSGRSSTIMSRGGGTGGTKPYANSLLGQAG